MGAYNKEIYIVFSKTNTKIGKMIRFFTKNDFNHVSLCLGKDLLILYSCARYHVNSPFVGGFVIEKPFRFFDANQDVTIKVCKFPTSECTYDEIEALLGGYMQDRNLIIYNTLNAFLSIFHKKLIIQNAYTCVEFVASVLNIQDIISIKELEIKLENQIVYFGSYKKYIESKVQGNEEVLNEEYFRKQSVFRIVKGTITQFNRLVYRLIAM